MKKKIFIIEVILIILTAMPIANVMSHTMAVEEKIESKLDEKTKDESIKTKKEEKELKQEKAKTISIDSQNKKDEKVKTVNEKKEKPEKIIEDGIYQIAMFEKGKSNLGLEVAKGETSSGVNIELGNLDRNKKNQFKFTYNVNDGYYEIQSVLSEKMLDVEFAGMSNGTNVWQYKKNGTDAQKWEVAKNSDGSYSIISKLNGLYLDIEFAMLEPGKNVQLYQGNNTKAQKFQLKKIEKPKKTIEDGIYQIAMFEKGKSNLGLEVVNGEKKAGANIELGNLNRNNKNQFEIKYNINDGYYEIKSVASEKMLDVEFAGMINGTNVWQYNKNGTDAQKWEIEKNSDGSYSIISKLNGLYLDVEFGMLEPGKNVQLYQGNNTKAQKFQLKKIEKPKKTVEDGIYQIAMFDKNKSNLALEVAKNSKEKTANIQLGLYESKEKSKFKIKYDSKDSCYEIQSITSGKMLDVEFAGMVNETNIWQYDKNGSDAQKWQIIKNPDGSFNLVSKLNGLYLDVKAGIIKQGTNIQVFEGNNTNAQKFNLIKAEELKIEEGTYKIVTATNPDISINIKNNSRENMANIELGTRKLNIENEFNIKYDKGSYIITTINSGKALDVKYAGMTNGTNIWQYDLNSSSAQRWEIAKNCDGTYSIISKLNGLYLDVEWGKIEKGRNIQLFEENNTNAQKFKLVKQENKTEKVLEEGNYKIETKINNKKVIEIGRSK